MTQDRPERAELLDAVAEFLFTEVRDSVPREQRFQVLVAANVCAVVAREIRSGPGPLLEDLLLFTGLLEVDVTGADDLNGEVRTAKVELSRRLRSGEFDDRLGAVATALREHVSRKLAVARPGYDQNGA